MNLRHLLALVAVLASVGPVYPATLCVWTNSPHPGAPYNAWTNAARDIQTAVNAAAPGDTVLVTNGLYASGSYTVPPYTMSNRVVITTSIVVRSVNGPAVTTIRGRAAGETADRRCVYITGGGQLSGFTLTNGAARGGAEWLDSVGGGVLVHGSGLVSNCVVCSNSAVHGGGIAAYYGGEIRNCFVYGNSGGMGSWFYGGGFYGSQGGAVYDSVFSNNSCALGGGIGTEGNCRFVRCLVRNNQATSGGGVNMRGGDVMENCVIVSNAATTSGGGIAFQSVGGRVRNCTVVGNRGGAGIYCVGEGILVNSIIVQNGSGSDNLPGTGLGYQADHLCTTPLPSNGTGHVTADPLLLSGWRLASNSPCVDAGCTNGPADDCAGVSRPLDGNNDGTSAWDIGAYEYIHPSADSDSDGMQDSAEVRAGTDATNAESFLFVQVDTSAGSSVTGVVVRWASAAGRTYRLDRSTNLVAGAGFVNVISNVAALPPLNVYTDKTASGLGPWLYRIGVK